MPFSAYYLPASEERDPSKTGFLSFAEAVNYVASRLCKICKEDFNRGYEEDPFWDNGKYPINSPLDTSCGAEWDIVEEKE
jgi:hypothetical protein